MSRLNDIRLSQFDRAYFIGVGGIGMSALARYFVAQGWKVAGYDKTPSVLTDQLIREGVAIHFDDLGSELPEEFTTATTLVIYTPAIPGDHGELNFFLKQGAVLLKRSEVLGLITRQSKGLGVAGTHGKTTTSSMLAHVLNESSLGCNAFLGGIATNFESNLVLHPSSAFTVIEADEFDRSFLQLTPYASIVTSNDPDHLDIYGDANYFREGFRLYSELIDPKGILIQKEGLDLRAACAKRTYGIDSSTADLSGFNLRFSEGTFLMDVRCGAEIWEGVELGIPGIHNAENALGCIGLCQFLGLSEAEIRHGLKTFAGVKRRFEYKVRKPKLVYIDDYAHHPTEISALVSSVRLLYPGQKIIGIFQPHLFSRTRDFFQGFAEELAKLDELVLLPIYPAREEPIPGVTSAALLEKISMANKQLLDPKAALEQIGMREEGIILTIGAGDIDRIVEPLKAALS
jgi:UDP-N-acetylmuramate--alanine ligase